MDMPRKIVGVTHVVAIATENGYHLNINLHYLLNIYMSLRQAMYFYY
jgi:hypothetical protein